MVWWGEQGGGGFALPQRERERGWAMGLASRPRNYLLQRVTKKPLKDSQETLLSSRTTLLSKSWEALLHSQPADLGWHLLWCLPEHL